MASLERGQYTEVMEKVNVPVQYKGCEQHIGSKPTHFTRSVKHTGKPDSNKEVRPGRKTARSTPFSIFKRAAKYEIATREAYIAAQVKGGPLEVILWAAL